MRMFMFVPVLVSVFVVPVLVISMLVVPVLMTSMSVAGSVPMPVTFVAAMWVRTFVIVFLFLNNAEIRFFDQLLHGVSLYVEDFVKTDPAVSGWSQLGEAVDRLELGF